MNHISSDFTHTVSYLLVSFVLVYDSNPSNAFPIIAPIDSTSTNFHLAFEFYIALHHLFSSNILFVEMAEQYCDIEFNLGTSK